MNERVCVHGAAGSIGSSCVEIITGKNHIILDYGKPLEGEGAVPFVFPKSPERRRNYKVFVSHSHCDHAGFVAEIPQDVEVYMHEMTHRALMLQDSSYGKRTYTLVHGYEIIRWNGINIMFIPVNHSAPDSCGILVSTKEQTLLYTGDFRLHGTQENGTPEKETLETRTSESSKPENGTHESNYAQTVKAYLKEQDFSRARFNVITEATNVGSGYSEKNIETTEQDIMENLSEEFRKPGLIVVRMANQNIERLKTIYDACIRTGRTLVTEPYTALCAKELTSYVELCPLLDEKKTSRPYNMYPDGKTWKIFCMPTEKTREMRESGTLYQFGGGLKIPKEELTGKSENIVIVANTDCRKFLQRNRLVSRIIWSMWDGYPEFKLLSRKFDVSHIHVSGHAYESHLKSFIRQLKPCKTIIIHTERPQEAANILKEGTRPILPPLHSSLEL